MMIDSEQPQRGIYSERAIYIATFFGGPLAAGILMASNYKLFGKDEAARKAIIIASLATIGIIILLLSIPESIIDKIPQQLLPFIYTGIVYLAIIKYQQGDIQRCLENGYLKASGWKIFGISVLSLTVTVIVFFVIFYLSPADFDTDKYNNYFQEFANNEARSLEAMDSLQNTPKEQQLQKVEESIEIWKNNLSLIDSLNSVKYLPEDLHEIHEKLKKYCDLRIESLSLLKLAIVENTDKYYEQINDIMNEINKVLK